jgi:hypothetical protein
MVVDELEDSPVKIKHGPETSPPNLLVAQPFPVGVI